jgi:hypothetical protein
MGVVSPLLDLIEDDPRTIDRVGKSEPTNACTPNGGEARAARRSSRRPDRRAGVRRRPPDREAAPWPPVETSDQSSCDALASVMIPVSGEAVAR